MAELIRGLIKDRKIRFMAVDVASVVNKADKLKPAYPLVKVALARLCAVTAMTAHMNKEDDAKVSVKIQGDGPINIMIVDGNTKGELRCYVRNPYVDFDGKLDLAKAFGQGKLSVTNDLGIGRPFVSEVPLQNGQIGDDFAYYFAHSEQTPTLVALGVDFTPKGNFKSAVGLILQLLPDSTQEDIDYIEARDYTNLGRRFKGDLNQFLSDLNLETEFSETFPLKYKCNCSKRKFIKSLKTLNQEDIIDMIEVDHGAEITCDFCNKKVWLSEEDLKKCLK